jgi:integration host factor subunit beta
MKTITKKELIEQVAASTKQKRVIVKVVVQSFLDAIIVELGRGNRLEFRDFGVFHVRDRKARLAQNPKTHEKVPVPPKRTVKFKVGRMMKQILGNDHQPKTRPRRPADAKPAAVPASAPAPANP